MILAERLRYAREQAGLSQSELARRAGLRPQTVQAIEAGAVRRPRALMELARLLRVRSEWLVWEEGPMMEPAVSELPADYVADPEARLSTEAVSLARDWMTLPRQEREAIQEVVQTLRSKRMRAPRSSRDEG
ncbi:MAG: helix-turn-helix transcriptional regulator [Acidiferrobacteraceae bacterium]